MVEFLLCLIFFSKFVVLNPNNCSKIKQMNIPEYFYELTKEEQEEEANRITEKYYKLAEKWRKVAILVRASKIPSNPLKDVSRVRLN